MYWRIEDPVYRNMNIYSFFWEGLDGDSNPIPQNSSQADKYLTNMAVTDPLLRLYF